MVPVPLALAPPPLAPVPLAPVALAPVAPPVVNVSVPKDSETHLLLREMIRLLEKPVEKPVTEKPEKPIETVEVRVDRTLYVCIGVAVLMTLSALSATLSSMRWESKYSKLVDRVIQIIQASNA